MRSGPAWDGYETTVEDGAVLAVPVGVPKCFLLNSTAGEIWRAWRLGQTPEEIARQLARTYEESESDLLRDIHTTLLEWSENGLIGAGRAAVAAPKPKDVQRPDRVSPPPVADTIERHYRLADLRFAFRYETPAIRDAVHPIFSHLEIPMTGRVDRSYDLAACAGQFTLHCAGQDLSAPTAQALAMEAFREIALAGYRDRDNLLVLHSAAVADDKGCVVLPGAGGSGKSTLTVALMDRGYRYLSDDVVPIERASRKAVPMPFSMNLKAGSRAVLADRLRCSSRNPLEYRWEDRSVWYLPPEPSERQHWYRHYPVRLMVFPRWGTDFETKLTRLKTVEKIERLIASDSLLGDTAQNGSLAEVIAWLKELPSYSLEYSSLDEAAANIESFLTGYSWGTT